MYVVLDNPYEKSRVIVLTITVIKRTRIENCSPENIRGKKSVIVYRLNET